jgi:hypothetical protein
MYRCKTSQHNAEGVATHPCAVYEETVHVVMNERHDMSLLYLKGKEEKKKNRKKTAAAA